MLQDVRSVEEKSWREPLGRVEEKPCREESNVEAL